MIHRTEAAAIGIVLLVGACSSEPAEPVGPSSNPAAVHGGPYEPDIDPADFVDVIDNPYMPLTPGSLRTYIGSADGEREREEYLVTFETKEVMGVATTLVHDKVYLKGALVEDTLDWFAQDVLGNVWYFGEDSRDVDHGTVVSREGSWEAGIDGAQPGIVMPAAPRVGDLYRQEFYAGEAEDTAEVLRLHETVTVPHGSFEDVLVTEDRNPLEPGFVENKYYAPGVGVVFERMMQGGEGELELTSVETIDPPRFASIEEAVAFLETKVDVPVVLPKALPKGTRLTADPVYRVGFNGLYGWSLSLAFGVQGSILLSYGLAIFDGCGGDSAKPVDIAGRAGLINDGHHGAVPYADVIWPVADGTAEGRYGVSATLPRERVIAMAVSMERSRVEASREEPLGC